MLASTQLDIKRDVLIKLLIALIVGTSITINKKTNYHIIKKHASTTSKQSTLCRFCEQEFRNYFSPQQHRRKKNEAKQWKPSDTVADLIKIVEGEV